MIVEIYFYLLIPLLILLALGYLYHFVFVLLVVFALVIDLLEDVLGKSIAESGVTQTDIVVVKEQEGGVLSVVSCLLVAPTRILRVVAGFHPSVRCNDILHQTDTGTHRTSLAEDIVEQFGAERSIPHEGEIEVAPLEAVGNGTESLRDSGTAPLVVLFSDIGVVGGDASIVLPV